MRIAVVAGGWHYPEHFYREMSRAKVPSGCCAHYFCIAHRHPDLSIVSSEKIGSIPVNGIDPLAALDRELYSAYASHDGIIKHNWTYFEAPNICGDWCFMNQWAAHFPWKRYDRVLTCHDDTYIRDHRILKRMLELSEEFPVVANSRYPEAPEGYARGSFEMIRSDLLAPFDGQFPLGDVILNRTGLTDTPSEFNALSPWNATCDPLRHYMAGRGLNVGYVSRHYRISAYVIEGERGLLHSRVGAPWSVEAGIKEFGLIG